MENDTYYTIARPVEAVFTEKRSRFLSFIIPVSTIEEALAIVADFRKKYYDARHVCWAYRIGKSTLERSYDDGEPSGTAGKPILGRLVSAELSDVLAIVVRYFGGIKLGTSGLIEAYRNATAMAIDETDRKPVVQKVEFDIHFGYDLMGEVMRLLKDASADILEQDCQQSCKLKICIRAKDSETLNGRLSMLHGCKVTSIQEEKRDEEKG